LAVTRPIADRKAVAMLADTRYAGSEILSHENPA
jgi:hypothetical protein